MNSKIGTSDAVTLVLSKVSNGTEERIEYKGNSMIITQQRVQEKPKDSGGK
mgnify:CR=1 FL=1